MDRDPDFRSRRRRGFDHDDDASVGNFRTRSRFAEARFEAPSGPPMQGVVKWFKPEKGFGFVVMSDGSGDAFLHGSVLARSGHDAVHSGETLEVRVAAGQKGPQITEVISIDRSTATPTAPRGGFRPERQSEPDAVDAPGMVKWFNPEKGYGFIALDAGGADVFVHISTVERSGLPGLHEEQRVSVDIAEGRKGPEAVRVRLV